MSASVTCLRPFGFLPNSASSAAKKSRSCSLGLCFCSDIGPPRTNTLEDAMSYVVARVELYLGADKPLVFISALCIYPQRHAVVRWCAGTSLLGHIASGAFRPSECSGGHDG